MSRNLIIEPLNTFWAEGIRNERSVIKVPPKRQYWFPSTANPMLESTWSACDSLSRTNRGTLPSKEELLRSKAFQRAISHPSLAKSVDLTGTMTMGFQSPTQTYRSGVLASAMRTTASSWATRSGELTVRPARTPSCPSPSALSTRSDGSVFSLPEGRKSRQGSRSSTPTSRRLGTL
eukprot:TRINITY_DN123493_c0_g1_i1.p1 TRINITY_DN123493_c0_g1~~TRINITY_DN123493_c0_g1_i1.p1  ORF type:complete len:177 (-),score=22.08 TRINITY_DN123493_c0_g1_i1:124-654(-)